GASSRSGPPAPTSWPQRATPRRRGRRARRRCPSRPTPRCVPTCASGPPAGETGAAASRTPGPVLPTQRNDLLVRPWLSRLPARGAWERGTTMTTSTAVTGNDLAGIERDLRRMELLNRREHQLRTAGRAAPVTSYLQLATRAKDRRRSLDA